MFLYYASFTVNLEFYGFFYGLISSHPEIFVIFGLKAKKFHSSKHNKIFQKLVARKFYSSKYKEIPFCKNVKKFLYLGFGRKSAPGSPIYNY